MIKSYFFPQKNGTYSIIPLDEIQNHLSRTDGFIWVNLVAANAAEINQVLDQIFHFHPLTIEDCLSSGYQTAKVDDFVDYLFIIAHAIITDENFDNLQNTELDIFLGDNYIVTCTTDSPMPPIEKILTRIQRDSRVYAHGSDFFCHAILDTLVDDYMPLIDKMESEIDWVEDAVVENPSPQTLQKLLSLKHAIMSLRRVIFPLREVINRLSRGDFSQISSQSQIYFRDIYDHIMRIQDLTDTIRDIVSGSMDIYLNSTSLRLNEVMKALTIVSTIFLPLSFVAGVYGMNFVHMPGLASESGFLIICVVFLAIAFAMLGYFKIRRWF